MIGFTQLLLVILVGFLLFGDLPKKVEEFSKAAKLIKKNMSHDATPTDRINNNQKDQLK